MGRTKKISVTIDAKVLAEAKKRARADQKTLSAYVNDALAERERHRSLGAALEELDRELGPIPPADLRKARDVLAQADRALRKRPRRRAA